MTAAISASGRRLLYLTKSLFQKACECPQKLRYHLLNQQHDSSVPQKPMDPFLATLAESGQRVGAYARAVVSSLHQHANATVVDMSEQQMIVNKSLQELVQETHALIEDNDDPDPKIILEGAIQSGSCLIRADILEARPTQKNNEKRDIHLKEVKAKAWNSSISRDEQLLGKRGGVKADFLPYLLDVAFQKFVVQRAFPALTVTAHLVMPDKSKINTQIPNLNGSFHRSIINNCHVGLDNQTQQWIRDAALDGEHLLATVDVDDIVTDLLQGNLMFPGSIRTGKEGKQHRKTFQEAVAEWELLVESINEDSLNEIDATKSMQSLSSSKIVPPIGSHCKSCEFRTSTDSGAPSGFHQCWQQATGLTERKLLNGGTLVLDLYYGGRSVAKFLDQEKYFLSDLTNIDLGLNEVGSMLEKKEKKRVKQGEDVTASKKKRIDKARGMTTAQRQSYQISDKTYGDNEPSSRCIIEQDYLASEMDSWKFPYHFIDFETSAPALPYSIGRKPFDVLCFQFSHHVLYKDGQLQHATEFIHAVPGECPNEPFIVALSECMEKYNEGTVFRWASHENTVLTALLEKQNQHCSLNATNHLKQLLTGGERSMVDLAKVAAKCFYVSGSDGSSSLKKVLLPTMAASERLKLLYEQPTYNGINFTNQQWWQPSEVGTGDQNEKNFQVKDPYSLLVAEADDNGLLVDGNTLVTDGGDAIVAYDTLQRTDINPAVRTELQTSLLRYCELDTLAMAMVVQAWQDVLDQ